MENLERNAEGAARRAVQRVLAGMVSREIRELAASFRFRVTVVLTLTLMVVSAVAGRSRFRAEMREHERLSQELAGAVEGTPLADLLREPYPVFKPPWKLAVLSAGRQRWTPDLYRSTLSVYLYPELTRHRDAEPGLAREPLDWAFVIRVILSMAAFALGYDAICGKKQRAILEMVLSYPVFRWQVVTAKLVAVWACVAAPFVFGAIISLLILAAFGGIRFSAAELVKSGLLILIGLWACAFFAAVALWVSLRAREPPRSLAVLVLLWVTAVVAIPGAGGLLAQTVLPLPTDQEITRRILAVSRAVEKQRGGPGGLRDPANVAAGGHVTERATAATQNLRYRLQEVERRQRVRDELAQVELAHGLSSASPMFLIQDLAERLVGSGPSRDRGFVEQAWDFGDSLAARTVVLDDEDPESPRLWEGFERQGPVRLLPGFAARRPVAPGDLPDFVFRERSLREGLRAAAPRVLLFALFTAVVLILLRAAARGFEVGRPG